MIHGGLVRRETAVHQLELVPREDPQQSKGPLPKLDDKTLREVVALMAEAILAVLGNRTEGDDER